VSAPVDVPVAEFNSAREGGPDRPPTATPLFGSATVRPAIHFACLDGIRGLAAAFVVVHHAVLEMDATASAERLPFVLQPFMAIARLGHQAVAVFIVLSGFCLMLPVLRNDGELRGGVRGFFYRRAMRILPPYYAAMALCLLVVVLLPGMGTSSAGRWRDALPAFSVGVLSSHVGLVHNLSLEWAHKIDPPMWSIATEAQIYIVFALLLAPVTKRYGIATCLLVSFVLGIAPRFLFPTVRALDQACPWYLGLFCLGMAGAVVVCRNDRERSPRRNAMWLALAAASVAALVATRFAAPELVSFENRWYSDSLIGLGAACIIVYALISRSTSSTDKPGLLNRFLEHRMLTWTGKISYSLYLIHFPVLCILHYVAFSPTMASSGEQILFLLMGLMASFFCGWLFYWSCERHFLGNAPRAVVSEVLGVRHPCGPVASAK